MRGLSGQAVLLGIGYLIRSVGSLLLAVVLARQLGSGGYGEVSVFLAIAWGSFYLAASWIVLTVPALSPARDAEAFSADVFWTAVVLAFAGVILSCLVLGVAALVAGETGEDLLTRSAWAVIPVAAVGLLATHSVYALLQSVREAGRVGVLQALERLLALALVAVAITLDPRPLAAMWAIAGATALTACAGFALRPVRLRLRAPRFDRATFRRAAAFSWPLAVTNVAAYVVGWIDLIILAAFLPSSDVGVYAVAYQFFAMLTALAAVWVLAAVPIYAQSRQGGDSRAAEGPSLDQVARASLWWSGLVLTGGVLAVALFEPVFGMEFGSGAGVAALLLAAACLLAPYYALVPPLIASGRIRTLMWVSVAAALINILLDVLLVSSLGIWAAAVGTVAQTLVATAALVLDAFGPSALPKLIATTAVPVAGLGLLAAWPDAPLVLAAVAAVAVATLGLTARANPVPVLAGLRAAGLARS